MINWWKTKPKSPETPAEITLQKIKEILFPEIEKHSEVGPDGTKYEYYVDSSVDSNLDAALYDLLEGYADETVSETIRNMSERVFKVRQLLNAFSDFEAESNISYLVVDSRAKDGQDI